jgi:hypothetical protein
MAIDREPAEVVTSALQAIPFGSLIGGPLDACIQAQAAAAKTTYEFINTVGFDAGGKSKNVVFEYQKEGKIVSLVVPVLVIVPIPYIEINTISIGFMANISAASSSVSENAETTGMGAELGVQGKGGWGPFSLSTDFKANYSSKKDSKATQESKYSVEYTMNVHLTASQSNMPPGLATLLNVLQGSITGSSPGGDLTVSPKDSAIARRDQAAYFEFTVMDSRGLLLPEQEVSISLKPDPARGLKLLDLVISPGTPVGASTPTSATAKSDGFGVVGVTVRIDPKTRESDVNVLTLEGRTTIPHPDGSHGVPKKATSQLTVLAQTVRATKITASQSSLTFTSGGSSQTFTATLLDENDEPVPGRAVTAQSGNTAIATVSPLSARTGNDGKAQFTVALPASGATGPTQITVVHGDLSDDVLVTVNPAGQ